MNNWQKAGIAVAATGAALTGIHLINKFIFTAATSKELTKEVAHNYYEWRFGKIAYLKVGEGTPIVLIHDMKPYSSSYVWNKMIAGLAKDHTVYAIDLIGCGKSDRPNITYTAYLYVQMLNDFIKNVVGERTDIVVSGDSSSMAIMSCQMNSELYGKVVLINPTSIEATAKLPHKVNSVAKNLLGTHIIGTLIYNISMSKKNIRKELKRICQFDTPDEFNKLVDIYYENAHIGGTSAKGLSASIKCNYVNIPIANALSTIDNSIIIINSDSNSNAENITSEYIELNNAIETCTIHNSKKLPQLENPKELLKQLKIFL